MITKGRRGYISLLFLFVIFFPAVFLFAAQPPEEFLSIPPFEKNDRILVFAPHPDDETIGAGGAIQAALTAGAAVYVACYTNGDANEIAFIAYEKRLTFFKGEFLHMGGVRRKETLSALKLLGVDEKNIFFLGYPDIGTRHILLKYWGNTKPYRSGFTRVSNVPYDENLSPQAPYKGESILKDIKTVLAAAKPTKIFVSHPADTNGDHQSLYVFLQVALWDLGGKIPEVYPFLVHYVRWPKPRGYHPDLALVPPPVLSGFDILWRKLDLTEGQIKLKNEAIGLYKSQIPYNPRYLYTFSRKNELFGSYPVVSLKEPKTSAIDWQKAEQASGFLSYAKKDGKLFIKMSFNRNITRAVTTLVYLLGYSKKCSFAAMPKIRLLVTRRRLFAYDKKNRIFVSSANMKVEDNSVIIEFPLAALNSPDFILSYVRPHTSSAPPAEIAWRVIKNENQPAPEAYIF